MSNRFERYSLRVYESAAELYGMPLPKEVNERIEEDLRYVSESDVFKMMLIISDVFKGMRIATENMPVIGYCEGFFCPICWGTLESILRGNQSIYRQDEFTLLVVKEMMEQGFSFGACFQRVIKNINEFNRHEWE